MNCRLEVVCEQSRLAAIAAKGTPGWRARVTHLLISLDSTPSILQHEGVKIKAASLCEVWWVLAVAEGV